ncbi:MAG: SET domain-containing protein [Paracoccaceae bacterium]|jgi:hypothetical protein
MQPKYNKFYYKPLPGGLEIKRSTIEGLGLFATENIPGETDLGMSHIKVPIIQGYIRTALGGFVNHAGDENCFILEKLDWDDYRIFHIMTSRDIYKGEELTLNYHADEEGGEHEE